jgi:CRP-like cAMP-binding protein
MAEGANGLLVEIIRPDELFGESAFLADPCPYEQATALENTTVMKLAIADVQDLVVSRPEFAIALLHFFARRSAEIKRRIDSLSLETIERRLARSLIRFAQRLGKPGRNGSVRMTLTHEMLSRHVGASSEVIAQCMNRFHEQGYVSYSRCGIVLCQDPFQKLLSQAAGRLSLKRRSAR